MKNIKILSEKKSIKEFQKIIAKNRIYLMETKKRNNTLKTYEARKVRLKYVKKYKPDTQIEVEYYKVKEISKANTSKGKYSGA